MKFSWNKSDKWVLRFFAGFVGGTAIGTVIGDTTNGLILGIMLGTAFENSLLTNNKKIEPPKVSI